MCLCVFVLSLGSLIIVLFFSDMPCMKRLYKNKNVAVHWSAAGRYGIAPYLTESASSD